MAKSSCSNMIIVGVLLLFIVMVMINKGMKEGYVVAPRGRTAARVDARTYSGPGDAVRGPVAPAKKPVKRARRRRAVVWYNPGTWRWW
jgi:hypothetical protein